MKQKGDSARHVLWELNQQDLGAKDRRFEMAFCIFPIVVGPLLFSLPIFPDSCGRWAGGQVGIHRSPLPLTEGEDPLEKQERICVVWVALNHVTVSLFLAGN